MNTSYSRPLLILLLAFVLLLAWVVGPVLNEFGSPRVKLLLIGVVGSILLAVYLRNARRRLADHAVGRSREDEFTHLARLNAGNAAFRLSLLLWLAIFALQGFFDSTRSMLGAGVLGQCGLYGICLMFFHRTGSLDEDQG